MIFTNTNANKSAGINYNVKIILTLPKKLRCSRLTCLMVSTQASLVEYLVSTCPLDPNQVDDSIQSNTNQMQTQTQIKYKHKHTSNTNTNTSTKQNTKYNHIWSPFEENKIQTLIQRDGN